MKPPTPNELAPPSRVGPAIATVFFGVLVPGTVAGWIPYRISGWTQRPPFFDLAFLRWAGPLLVVVGLPVLLDFLFRFVKDGFGTPAPFAEPKRLVVTGIFRYVRNPGYLAVILMVVGQGLYFGSADVLGYAACLMVGFHLFVVLYEEPHLREKHGSEYREYCRRVPRWTPRWSSGTIPPSTTSRSSSPWMGAQPARLRPGGVGDRRHPPRKRRGAGGRRRPTSGARSQGLPAGSSTVSWTSRNRPRRGSGDLAPGAEKMYYAPVA